MTIAFKLCYAIRNKGLELNFSLIRYLGRDIKLHTDASEDVHASPPDCRASADTHN
jgi:hypothetical protein